MPYLVSSTKPPRSRACQPCRRRKIRCTGVEKSGVPCANCVQNSHLCVYEGPTNRKREPSAKYAAQLEARVKYMYQILEKHAGTRELYEELGFREVESLQSTKSPEPSVDYNASPFINSEYLKGMRWLNDGLFDWYSFRDAANDSDSDDTDARPGEQYHGSSSTLTFLTTAVELKERDSGMKYSHLLSFPRDLGSLEFADLIRMGGNYEHLTRSKVLPSQDFARKLFDLYFRYVNPFFPLLDRETFEAQYAESLHTRDPGFSRLVHLVCALASTYCPEDSRVYYRHEDGLHSTPGSIFFYEVKNWLQTVPPTTLIDVQGQVLTALYRQFSGDYHACWRDVGVAFRLVQDVGIHRMSKRQSLVLSPLQLESYVRAFWCILILDRITSSAIGHGVAIRDTEFDVSLPTVLSHELAAPGNITYFVCLLKLLQTLSLILGGLYPARRGPFTVQQPCAEVVQFLESTLKYWFDSIPDELRWDPNCPDDTRLEQAGELMLIYHYCTILIHQRFILSDSEKWTPAQSSSSSAPDLTSESSLKICTHAALESSHIAAVRASRGLLIPPISHSTVFISGMVLLMGVWRKWKEEGPDADVREWMDGVKRCIASLRAIEYRSVITARTVDVLVDLASKEDGDISLAEMTLPSVYLNHGQPQSSFWGFPTFQSELQQALTCDGDLPSSAWLDGTMLDDIAAGLPLRFRDEHG